MIRMITLFVLGICLACTNTQRSHTETAQIVVESFYQKNLPTLQKHTANESFQSFLQIHDAFPMESSDDLNFRVLNETEDGNTAWVKFTTAYEEQPETFKLIIENGNWKVTEIGLGEKGPF